MKVTVTKCDICHEIDEAPDPARAVHLGDQMWEDVCKRDLDDLLRMMGTLVKRSEKAATRPPTLPVEWGA